MSAELAEVQTSVEDDIASAIEEIANKEEEPKDDAPEEAETTPKDRDESGKFTKQKATKEKTEKEPATKEAPIVEAAPVATTSATPASVAPQSWSGAVKAEWAKLPSTVQAEITKREADVHRMMTAPDGELRLGREMKDAITPYMPIITAEGGTPVKAVQELLNTAYLLRTGSQQQKAQMVQQIAQTYGVDLGQAQPQQQLDPAMQQILDRINGIENKFTQQSTLQQQEENARIMSEVSAFSADPKNVYFEQLKPVMAPLLASGQAKDLQEAYDKACWSDPAIRSTLIAAQQAEEAEKRKAEVAKKKQASASVTGSPGITPKGSTPNNNNVEDDVRAAMNELLDS